MSEPTEMDVHEQRVVTAFQVLLNRQPSDQERTALGRVAKALGLRQNDGLWLALIALQDYETRYGKIPARIEDATKHAVETARQAADREVEAALAAGRESLLKDVQAATQRVARQEGERSLWRRTAATAVVLLVVFAAGYAGHWTGLNLGSAELLELRRAAAPVLTCSDPSWSRYKQSDGRWACIPDGKKTGGKIHGWYLPEPEVQQ